MLGINENSHYIWILLAAKQQTSRQLQHPVITTRTASSNATGKSSILGGI